MSRSAWREQRNTEARARLLRALPPIFPAAVLVHAHGRALVPPLPRLAVESYWRAHPLRADRLCRALASRSTAPEGWSWRPGVRQGGQEFRLPPAPFRDPAHRLPPGQCCICGQPVYRFGWHLDLWSDGVPNKRAGWHACCVAAWKLWTVPNDHGVLLRRLQSRRCAVTGGRLLRGAEVDHRMPLVSVWRDHRDSSWPAVLQFWGFPNLQAVNRDAHARKSAEEAARRAVQRREAAAVEEAAP